MGRLVTRQLSRPKCKMETSIKIFWKSVAQMCNTLICDFFFLGSFHFCRESRGNGKTLCMLNFTKICFLFVALIVIKSHYFKIRFIFLRRAAAWLKEKNRDKKKRKKKDKIRCFCFFFFLAVCLFDKSTLD